MEEIRRQKGWRWGEVRRYLRIWEWQEFRDKWGIQLSHYDQREWRNCLCNCDYRHFGIQSNSLFKRCLFFFKETYFYSKDRFAGRSRDKEGKIFNTLVHSTNGHNDQSRINGKLQARIFFWVCLMSAVSEGFALFFIVSQAIKGRLLWSGVAGTWTSANMGCWFLKVQD